VGGWERVCGFGEKEVKKRCSEAAGGQGNKKIFVFLSKKPHFSLTKVFLVVNFQSILTF